MADKERRDAAINRATKQVSNDRSGFLSRQSAGSRVTRLLVSHEHASPEPFDGARIAGSCVDSAWLVEHDDCDVCLLVDQSPLPGVGRHALLRMDAAEAKALGNALVGAAEEGDQ